MSLRLKKHGDVCEGTRAVVTFLALSSINLRKHGIKDVKKNE